MSREHQLKYRLLAEAVWDDLQPSALLDEEALQKIRRARGAPVSDRQPQVRDAGSKSSSKQVIALGRMLA
jgi:hypothetical protein